MANEKKFTNKRNADGQPVDRNGNVIVDLRAKNLYYVTGSHPHASELGVGSPIYVSALTHGPAMLAQGYLSEEPIDLEQEPEAPKKSRKKAE